MSNYWIKLYHEILDDPKMGAMPHELWRRTIELFLMAGAYNKEGLLPPIDQIAWKLRMSQQDCNETLQELQRLCIVDATNDGNFVIKNFKKRQQALSSTERSRYHRAKNSQDETEVEIKQKKKRNGNATKRPQITDTESDTDILSPKGDSGPRPQGTSEKWSKANKVVVGNKFLELTHLKPPSDRKTAGYWWGGLHKLFEMGNKDPTETCRIMGIVVKYMQDENLTISSPKSLHNLARAVASGQELRPKNGAYANGSTRRNRQKNHSAAEPRSIDPDEWDQMLKSVA